MRENAKRAIYLLESGMDPHEIIRSMSTHPDQLNEAWGEKWREWWTKHKRKIKYGATLAAALGLGALAFRYISRRALPPDLEAAPEIADSISELLGRGIRIVSPDSPQARKAGKNAARIFFIKTKEEFENFLKNPKTVWIG